MTTELMEDIAPQSILQIIQAVISSLESLDDEGKGTAMVSHGDSGHIWKFKYGTVEVFVQLTGLTDDDTFTVWSSVLKLPVQDQTQLMQELLRMNLTETFEARFALSEKDDQDAQVVVISSRSVAELSPGEISRLITVVANIADEHDEKLADKYKAA